MNTKFAYTSTEDLTLDQSTEELMLAVDNFAYNVLNPDFASFGEIHDTLEICLVSRSDTKTRTVHVSLGDLRADLKKKQKLNEIIEEQNQEIWETTEDESQLLPLYNTDDLEVILDQHQGENDAVVVEFKTSYERLGYYTRENGHGLIVLVKTRNENQMIATLIHEYMHAWADKNATGSMNDAEYAEEEIAEFGMLRFLQTIANSDTRFRQVLLDAIQAVKSKQHTYGLAHYGFGAELYENYIHVSWERLLRDAHTLTGPDLKEYEKLKNMLQVYPDKSELDMAANLLNWVLLASQNTNVGPYVGSGNAGVLTKRTLIIPRRNIFVSIAEAELELKMAEVAQKLKHKAWEKAKKARHEAYEAYETRQKARYEAEEALDEAYEVLKKVRHEAKRGYETLEEAREASKKACHEASEAEETFKEAHKALEKARHEAGEAYEAFNKVRQEAKKALEEAYEADAEVDEADYVYRKACEKIHKSKKT